MSPNDNRKPYRILSQEVWAEIRRQYIAGCGPAEICRRFGVARSTLTSRRAKEGWDELCVELGRIRSQKESLVSGSPLAAEQEKAGEDPPFRFSYESTEDQVMAHGRGVGEDGARNLDTNDVARRADAVNDAYLALAGALRRRVDAVTAEQCLAPGQSQRPHRDVLDAANALEKLQRVERTALGLNNHDSAPRTNVVILVPPKMDPGEWQSAIEGTGTSVPGANGADQRLSTAWDDGRDD